MVPNGGAPPRGSAAAAASLRRRRLGGGGGGGAAGGRCQHDAPVLHRRCYGGQDNVEYYYGKDVSL
ncbi:hypothetical protein C4D60_Mb11t22310 [Musa balbisiana]|uniref:Uncharacterized protein n=1 Tax=Musa balbisiana TaxID=52838 RepID=A0A4S8J8E8_MUSBA|nr:hypothetical protein C4D60_Mb11t22310 [Musa balbisiana]